jgi:hypothetical protein
MNGQYQHDDIIVFATGVERVFKSLYNPLQPGQGMSNLLKEAPNDLNSIKSTDMVEAFKILSKAKADAAKLSKQTGITKKPAFKTSELTPKRKLTIVTLLIKPPLEPRKVLLKPSPRKWAETSPI